jgi:hypothetical protein
MKILPEFFVVGTQKAGTTSLHDWLVKQPEICLPKLKETQFFSTLSNYANGIDWYLDQFPDANESSIVGEICPDYMYFEGVPERIITHCKSPKLIFIFRHPIDRAYSHYLMKCREGIESLPFHDALLQEENRMATNTEFAKIHYSYMSRGEYASQVKSFQRVFKRELMYFIKFDDLVDKGQRGDEAYANICNFLGVKSSPTLARRQQISNPASEPKYNWIRDLLYKPSTLKLIVGYLVPSRTIKEQIAFKVDRMNQKPIKKKTDYTVPEKVVTKAREEIVKLQELTKLDLGNWLDKSYLTE